MQIMKTTVRSLVVSLVVATVVLVAVVSVVPSYRSSMTPEEQESLKSMTLEKAQAFLDEKQVLTSGGWSAVRGLLSNPDARKNSAKSHAILALCGFLSSLSVAAWSGRSAGRKNTGVPNKAGGH
jgi:hypothetical protein